MRSAFVVVSLLLSAGLAGSAAHAQESIATDVAAPGSAATAEPSDTPTIGATDAGSLDAGARGAETTDIATDAGATGARSADAGALAPTTEGAPGPATALQPPSDPSGVVGADPVVRASIQDGFQIESADGSMGLRLGGLLAGRFIVTGYDGEDADTQAQVRLGRVMLVGHLLEQLFRFTLNVEFVGTPQLLDLEMTIVPMPELTVRLGRFRTPFGRQWMEPLTNQQLPERSLISDFYRANRDTGVALAGQIGGGILEYQAGVFDEGLESMPLVMGRVVVSPLGPTPYDETFARTEGEPRLAVGANVYHYQRGSTLETVDPITNNLVVLPGPDTERTAGGVDVAVRVGPWTLFAEGYLDAKHITDLMGGVVDRASGGAFAQTGVFVLAGLLEFAGRYDWLAPDLDGTHARGLHRFELGANVYFFEGRVKAQARYAYAAIDGGVNRALISIHPGHFGDLQLMAFF